MKRIVPIIALIGLLLSSCGTQRQTTQPRRFQTLNQKASATLELDQHKYTMSCAVQMWRNELIILSLQPMLGIEMMRMEATKDSVVVVDKMNRRYTVIDYDIFANQLSQKLSFRLIQDFVSTPITPEKEQRNQLDFSFGNHKILITCKFSQREYNTLNTPKRLDLQKYKQVSLLDILPL